MVLVAVCTSVDWVDVLGVGTGYFLVAAVVEGGRWTERRFHGEPLSLAPKSLSLVTRHIGFCDVLLFNDFC